MRPQNGPRHVRMHGVPGDVASIAVAAVGGPFMSPKCARFEPTAPRRAYLSVGRPQPFCQRGAVAQEWPSRTPPPEVVDEIKSCPAEDRSDSRGDGHHGRRRAHGMTGGLIYSGGHIAVFAASESSPVVGHSCWAPLAMIPIKDLTMSVSYYSS